MTTYPSGLSKTVYLDRITQEGIEVGNYTINDASVGIMPNYALVNAYDHVPASSSSYNYISWSGTHTGQNVVLPTSAIPQCALICTVAVSFDDQSTGSAWNANQGVLLRIERSTNGGASWPVFFTQYVMFPCYLAVGNQQGSGPLGCVFAFSPVATSNIVVRLGTQAFGYNPSLTTRVIDVSMRIMAYNKL